MFLEHQACRDTLGRIAAFKAADIDHAFYFADYQTALANLLERVTDLITTPARP